MATVTITEDPCAVSIIGSKDPIVIKVAASSAVITPPAQEKIQLTFTSNPSDGDSLQIEINGEIANIDFVATITEEGAQCLVISGGQTLAQWINENLIPVLRMQPVLDGFEFSVGGPSSILTIYSLDFIEYDAAVTYSGFSMSWTPTDGTTAELAPDYSLKIQVQMTDVQSNNVFPIRSPWLYFKPTIIGGDGVVEQDLKEIVDSLFQEIDIPEESNQSVSDGFYSVRKMRIAVQEYYSNAEEINYITYSATTRVVKGGRKFGDADSTIPAEFELKFLTLRQDVYTDQRMYDWLYFVQPALGAGEKMWLRTSTLYDDGQWVDRNTKQITSLLEGRITRVPCGFNQLNLQLFSGNPVAYRCDIIRTNAAGVYIENIITSIEFKLLPESDYVAALHYQNSLGFVEAILLNGSAVFKSKYSRDIQTTTLPLESSRNEHKEIGYNIINQHEIDITTGPISKRSWLVANDILLSKRLWFVWVQGKNLKNPVQIVPGDVETPSFNPDGSGVTEMPLRLRFSPEKANSFKYQIIDL